MAVRAAVEPCGWRRCRTAPPPRRSARGSWLANPPGEHQQLPRNKPAGPRWRKRLSSGERPIDPGTTPDRTVLFDARAYLANNQMVPITAPDGREVDWAAFSAVSGEITVKCLQQGTHVVLHLRNLIPGGVYTVWNVTFKEDGFHPLSGAGPAVADATRMPPASGSACMTRFNRPGVRPWMPAAWLASAMPGP